MSIEKLNKPERSDQERIDVLKDLFPEAFSDGTFNQEILKEELHILDLSSEKDGFYELKWPGKVEAKKLAAKPFTGSLYPMKHEGINVENTRNILIEGENLEVLRILQKSYREQVKFIYIDPPYNTGNDFIYEDEYKESVHSYLLKTGQADEEGVLTSNPKSSGRFHTNWLNMMYPRLRLAKFLLKKEGVIAIHIDEHEQSNLELLMNEIFGEENRLGHIIWDKRNPKGDATGIAYQHESILVYARNKDYLLAKHEIKRPKRNAEKMIRKAKELFSKLGKTSLPDDLQEVAQKYTLPKSILEEHIKEYDLDAVNEEYKKWLQTQDDLSGGEAAYKCIDVNGDVYRPVSMAWPNKKQAPDDYFIPLIHPQTKKPCAIPQRGWRNPPSTMRKLLEENKILFGKDEKTIPNRKYLLKEYLYENIPSILRYGGSDDDLFNKLGLPFENPKPYRFAMDMIHFFTEEDDIIIDFFAGSGTTGHAVYELNEKYHTRRRFILVQVPEETAKNSAARKSGFNTISQITKKRLMEVATCIKQRGAVSDCGFKVFGLGKTNIRQWSDFDGDRIEELEERFDYSPLVPGWNEENVITELLLVQGFPLDRKMEILKNVRYNKVWKITHDRVDYSLYICLDKKLEEHTANDLIPFKGDVLILLDDAVTDTLKMVLSETLNVKTL